MEYNILILSAGRRVELIECFRRAAKELGISSRLVTAEISGLAPAVFFSDRNYMVPAAGSPEYLERLAEICREEKISLVVPTIDEELLPLSAAAEKLEKITGAKALVPPYGVVSVCRDKRRTCAFFERNGFGCPKVYTEEELEKGRIRFPLFIKPVSGSAGEGAHKIISREELDFYRRSPGEQMVQEFVSGDEYSVDVLCGFDARLVAIVPRRRLQVRAGEIVRGRVEKRRELIDDIKRMVSVLRPVGMLTVQCILSQDSIKYLEINPRFGGGVTMSILAGADFPRWIYQMLMGKQLEYTESYSDGAVFLRYDRTFEAKP